MVSLRFLLVLLSVVASLGQCIFNDQRGTTWDFSYLSATAQLTWVGTPLHDGNPDSTPNQTWALSICRDLSWDENKIDGVGDCSSSNMVVQTWSDESGTQCAPIVVDPQSRPIVRSTQKGVDFYYSGKGRNVHLSFVCQPDGQEHQAQATSVKQLEDQWFITIKTKDACKTFEPYPCTFKDDKAKTWDLSPLSSYETTWRGTPRHNGKPQEGGNEDWAVSICNDLNWYYEQIDRSNKYCWQQECCSTSNMVVKLTGRFKNTCDPVIRSPRLIPAAVQTQNGLDLFYKDNGSATRLSLVCSDSMTPLINAVNVTEKITTIRMTTKFVCSK